MAADEEKVGLVVVGLNRYTHDAFASAFHQAFLEVMEARVPPGQTQRGVFRALRDLRSDKGHTAVLFRALKILLGSPPHEGDGIVVAVFPLPVDNHTSIQ